MSRAFAARHAVEIIFQLLFELLLQFLVEGIANLLFGRLGVERPWLRFFFFALLGAVLGLASLVLAREHMIADGTLRYAAVLFIPIAIGLVMAQIGRLRCRRGRTPRGLEHFVSGWAFAFAFGAMRVVFAK